jgi:hypothetical protein
MDCPVWISTILIWDEYRSPAATKPVFPSGRAMVGVASIPLVDHANSFLISVSDEFSIETVCREDEALDPRAGASQPLLNPRCFRGEGLAAFRERAESWAGEGSEIGDPTAGGWFDKRGSRDDGRAECVQIEFVAVEGPQDALRRDDNFNGFASGVSEP